MIESLQSLRIIFVAMVFMSHFALNTTPFDYGGDCGVAFFFMLSGFVLSHAHGGQVADGSYAAGRFFKKRLFKLYPLASAMLAVYDCHPCRQTYFGRLRQAVA